MNINANELINAFQKIIDLSSWNKKKQIKICQEDILNLDRDKDPLSSLQYKISYGNLYYRSSLFNSLIMSMMDEFRELTQMNFNFEISYELDFGHYIDPNYILIRKILNNLFLDFIYQKEEIHEITISFNNNKRIKFLLNDDNVVILLFSLFIQILINKEIDQKEIETILQTSIMNHEFFFKIKSFFNNILVKKLFLKKNNNLKLNNMPDFFWILRNMYLKITSEKIQLNRNENEIINQWSKLFLKIDNLNLKDSFKKMEIIGIKETENKIEQNKINLLTKENVAKLFHKNYLLEQYKYDKEINEDKHLKIAEIIFFIVIGYLKGTNKEVLIDEIFNDLFQSTDEKLLHPTYNLLDNYLRQFISNSFSNTFLQNEHFANEIYKIEKSLRYELKYNWRITKDLVMNLKESENLELFLKNQFNPRLCIFLNEYYKGFFDEQVLDNLFCYFDSKIINNNIFIVVLSFQNIHIWEEFLKQEKKYVDNFFYRYCYWIPNLIKSSYLKNKVISKIDDLNLPTEIFNLLNIKNQIDPITFVDNNMLSIEDRKKFNELERKGDIIYFIIINHLILNNKLKIDNEIDYFSNDFQNKLIFSLDFKNIIQSNNLYFDNITQFSFSDYFEALLWSLYKIDKDYKKIYDFVLYLLFKENYVKEENKYEEFDQNETILIKYSKFNSIPKLFNLDMDLEKIKTFKLESIIMNYISKILDKLKDLNDEENKIEINNYIDLLKRNSHFKVKSLCFFEYLEFFSILDEKGLDDLIKHLNKKNSSIIKENIIQNSQKQNLNKIKIMKEKIENKIKNVWEKNKKCNCNSKDCHPNQHRLCAICNNVMFWGAYESHAKQRNSGGAWNLDHIKPISKSNDNSQNNLQAVHIKCSRKKEDK